MVKKRLRVGKIANTHGIRGELKVMPYTDYIERFEELEWVYIEDSQDKSYIKSVRYKGNSVLLLLDEYDNINQVERFKGKSLFIDETQKRELDEDTHYISDIIGLEVYTTEDEYLGKVVDIIQAGSSEVYVIKDGDKKEVMIPSVKKFIPVVDIEAGKIIVDPIEGMIE